MAEFPKLTGEASTGKPKVWQISVEPGTSSNSGIITIVHGYFGGKMQTNRKIIVSGKNIGRKNETSPLQQAVQDARTQWQKKVDSGYKCGTVLEIPIEVAAGRSKTSEDDIPSPMLAHDYNKRGKSISFPCYAQRKYDGTRCIAIPGRGLYSRNKKRYPNLAHITDELNMLPSSIVLDGELYSSEISFQEIISIVKKADPTTPELINRQQYIQFHVYDIITKDDTIFEDRYARLQALICKYKFNNIVLIKTERCTSIADVKHKHSIYVAEGYEGLILRNKGGLYKCGFRSVDLQKYKEFCDAEYDVVGYKEGEGLEHGCVIWICKTDSGKTFSCRPRGSREERAALYKNGNQYIGKMLTVRYQDLGDEGVPRFPVGIAFRDYE